MSAAQTPMVDQRLTARMSPDQAVQLLRLPEATLSQQDCGRIANTLVALQQELQQLQQPSLLQETGAKALPWGEPDAIWQQIEQALIAVRNDGETAELDELDAERLLIVMEAAGLVTDVRAIHASYCPCAIEPSQACDCRAVVPALLATKTEGDAHA